MEIVIPIMAFVFLSICLFIAVEYVTTKYKKYDIEVVMDDELKNAVGIENFMQELLKELSSKSITEYCKDKTRSQKQWAEKYWTFGKVTSVYLQHFEDDNSFSIHVTAKKLGNYTGYQMIFGDVIMVNEVEFRVHSINKSLFQPSFLVTYFSENNIPVKQLKKFNYKIAV